MILQKNNLWLMKWKVLMTLITVFLFLSSCQNQDNNTSNEINSGSNYLPSNTNNNGNHINKVSVDTSWINKKYIDLAYGNVSGSQKLDLYLPNEGSGPFPLIIEIHGGGFIMGDKSQQITPMLNGLNQGFAVASINYRHSKEASFPAAVNDVKAAIRFLRANAEIYNLNPNAFATWGGSAGGNLSAMAALSGGVQIEGNDNFENIDISDKVQAGIDWYGPVSFDTMDSEFLELGITPKMGKTSTEGSAESKYLGKVVGTEEAKALVNASNPASYIDPNDPPVFFQHGSLDSNIPYLQSKNLSEALGKVIGSDNALFELIEGASHGGSEFESEKNINKIFDFLNKHLK